jgi:hypothetical protein
MESVDAFKQPRSVIHEGRPDAYDAVRLQMGNGKSRLLETDALIIPWLTLAGFQGLLFAGTTRFEVAVRAAG